jgi:hypothetical protein
MTRIVEAAEAAGQIRLDKASLPLWAGVIIAPLAWAAHLQLGYMLVPWICTTQRYWVAHVVTLASLAVAGWCVYLCWREWRRLGGGWPSSSEENPAGRGRFLGVLGMMSGGLFFLLIAAGHLPIFYLSPSTD